MLPIIPGTEETKVQQGQPWCPLWARPSSLRLMDPVCAATFCVLAGSVFLPRDRENSVPPATGLGAPA